MVRALRFFIALATVAAWSVGPARAAAEAAPAWMLDATTEPVAVATHGSNAVVLLDEAIVNVGNNGRRVTRTRQVMRILKREGRERAIARVGYAAKIDKVTGLQAWLLQPDGRLRSFGKKEVIDVTTAPDLLYSDQRAAVIDASAEADAGSLFGWEGTVDELALIGQGVWGFQDTEPVALSRLVVRVPKGWRVEGVLRAHDALPPVVASDTFTWELRDLPAVAEEPYGPGLVGAAAHLGYDIRPAGSGGGRAGLRTFASWADTVSYALELHTSSARPEATVAAKAQELCNSAATRWDKIHALATYAQAVRYVAIAMNLGAGGGFRPHPAPEVLRCAYGDCKDKTTLLRALLAAEGIASWPVLCFSGDPTAVRDDWPSPIQFNHVLAAIELGDADAPPSPFIVEHPGLGRVLLFDPTDPYTLPGDFPDTNQGGRVLICTPGTTALTPVPVAPPENNHRRRRAKVGIEPNGAARVGTYEVSSGSLAAQARATYEHKDAVVKTVEEQLAVVYPSLHLARAEFGETSVPGQVTLRTGFATLQFCRTVRDQLLLFSPVLRMHERTPPLPDAARMLPILLPSYSIDESVEFLLPEGFRISETTPPMTIERPFGRYELQLIAEETRIVTRRTVRLNGGQLPASDYAEVRGFFDAIRKAEATPVVLERVAPK